MQQQNIPIHTLVDMYKRGELRLPEIQRHYVWRATRARDLLDSLYRGYPSGSILMWETDRLTKLRKVRDYNYVVHVLERAMSYEEVTEIFVRVNSLGAKLRSSDPALAQMTSRWPNLLKELEQFQDECEQSWSRSILANSFARLSFSRPVNACSARWPPLRLRN